MQSSGIPVKFTIPWANSAGSPTYVHAIPTASQIGITNNAASLTDGFPPDCFAPNGAPLGNDANGILKQITQWNQWQQAGAAVPWDSAFSAAIGGYPAGAVVAALTSGNFWFNTTENNTSDPETSGAGWLLTQATALLPQIGAQLQYSGSTSLLLAPVAGGYLWINGANYQVPASLTLSNSGIGNSVQRYVYAYMNSGSMTLEAVTTGYTLATNGIPQKAGDVTRTLVGQLFTTGSGTFSLTDGSIGVLTYFNRQVRKSQTTLATTVTAPTGNTWFEISTSLRNTFLVWAGETVQYSTFGSFIPGPSGASSTSVGFDGTTNETVVIGSGIGNSSIPCALIGAKNGLTEGSHYVTPLGFAANTAAQWYGTGSISAGNSAIGIIVTVNG